MEALLCVLVLILIRLRQAGRQVVPGNGIRSCRGFDALREHLLCTILLPQLAISQRGKDIGLSPRLSGGALPGGSGFLFSALRIERYTQPIELFALVRLSRFAGTQIFRILHSLLKVFSRLLGILFGQCLFAPFHMGADEYAVNDLSALPGLEAVIDKQRKRLIGLQQFKEVKRTASAHRISI